MNAHASEAQHEVSPAIAGDSPRHKLNILALPSFTAILFGLMAFVILGAVLSSLLPDSNLWWPPLVLGVILLTLRDFLHGPEREARRNHLQPLDVGLASLQSMLSDLAQQADEPAPDVLCGDRAGIWSFGTFRRSFVAVGRSLGISLDKYSAHPNPLVRNATRAILAHELAHFLNRDVQRAGLARSLLKITFLVAVVNLWIAIGLIAFIVQIGPEVAQPAFWVELSQRTGLPGFDLTPVRDMVRNQNPQVFDLMATPSQTSIWWLAMNYYASALLPFIISAGVLYIFLWRKLLRVREFYADAAAATLMTRSGENGVAAVAGAIDLMGTLTGLSQAPDHWRDRLVTLARKPFITIGNVGLLAYRSDPERLKEALSKPIVAFGKPWQIAAWAGVAVLLLELMLRGSLTALYINQPGPHLPLLATSIVFALWLLPQVCSGTSQRNLITAVITMTLIFTGVKLSINFLDALLVGGASLAGQLEPLGRVVDLWAYSLVGAGGANLPSLAGGEFSWTQIIRWHIISPIAYFTVFALPILIVTLLLDARLNQWVLTWYGLGQKVRRVFWAILVTLLILQGLITIPLGNRLFFSWIYPDWPLKVLLGMTGGLLLALVAGLTFVAVHQRLGGRCVACRQNVAGPFELGKTCPSCGAMQHPWLIAPY